MNNFLKISKKARIWCLRPKVQIKQIYWEFHKGDADFNPSMPHGHSLDGKYKLELWSGNIYEVSTKELKWIAKPKDMQHLYSHEGFQKFVKECRDEYCKNHPGFRLPPLTSNPKFKTSMRIFAKKRSCVKYNDATTWRFKITCEKATITKR